MTDHNSRPPEVAREVKFCRFDVKSVALDGVFEGYASLFNVEDLGHDVVLPGAFRDSIAERKPAGVKMLYQHDPAEPIGVWQKLHEDACGLFARGKLMTETARGREVLAMMRAGALDGLSIGFRMLQGRRDRFGVRRISKIDLWEISVVTFPMQPDARITAVKATAAGAGLPGAVGYHQPSEREFERWLTQDAGFTRVQARAVVDGFKSHGARCDRLDVAEDTSWELRLIGQLAEATRLLRQPA